MKNKYLYLILCILGVIFPYSQFVPWLLSNGLDIRLFIDELFSTKIGGFFGWDVILTAIVLLIFIFAEGKRIKMKHLWAPVLGTLSVGVSLGLPLFLYMREVHLESEHKTRNSD